MHIRDDRRLYVVLFSTDGSEWSMVKDQGEERLIPAAYVTADEAEQRRAAMQSQFPHAQYVVRGYSLTQRVEADA